MGSSVRLLLNLLLLASTCIAQSDVREPPSIKELTEEQKKLLPNEFVKEGVTFTLSCEATGIPEPTYSWTLNGSDLDLNGQKIKLLTKGNIQISSFDKSSQGQFQCTASNQYGKSLSSIYKVYEAFLAYNGKKEKIVVHGEEGKYFVINKTDFVSSPSPTYQWQTVSNLDDSAPDVYTRSKRVVMDMEDINNLNIDFLEGNLHFTSLLNGDALQNGRFYKAYLFNSVTDEGKGGSYTSVNVYQGAITDRKPDLRYPGISARKIAVLEGTEMKIQCIFSGSPEVTVTWNKPGTSKTTQTEFDTRLENSVMTKAEAGEYTCTGANRVGKDNGKITVELHTIPKFTEGGRPDKQTLTEGDKATFKCQTTTDTNPAATVEWMFNGELLTGKYPAARTQMDDIENGKLLTIVDLDRDVDNRVVQCKATNKYKTIYVDAALKVLVRTKFTVSPANQVATPNTTEVIFKCSATSDPSTTVTLEWLRNGKPLGFQEDPRITVAEDGGSLKIDFANLAGDQIAPYSGEYTCSASNGYSSVNHTATLEYDGGPTTGAVTSAGFPIWIILVIIAGVLLLLILILIICVCIQRNKGDSYPVDTKEREHGNDPVLDLEKMAFKDFVRREPEPETQDIEAPLTAQEPMGSNDSMDEYAGDYNEGKFSEDGSFIGQYDRKKIVLPTGGTSAV